MLDPRRRALSLPPPQSDNLNLLRLGVITATPYDSCRRGSAIGSQKVEWAGTNRFASEVIVMRERLSAGLALAAGLLIMSVPLFAHHGNAAFDTSKKLSLKGTVTEWVWANPHCWLKFDVKNDKGEVTHWLAEETNPPGLINSGWYKDSLKVGDNVTVVLIPTKNGQPMGRVDRVILANGKVLRYFGEGGGGQ